MSPDDKKAEEIAKAVAAASKFGTQAVKTTERILAFAAKVFKGPAEQKRVLEKAGDVVLERV